MAPSEIDDDTYVPSKIQSDGNSEYSVNQMLESITSFDQNTAHET